MWCTRKFRAVIVFAAALAVGIPGCGFRPLHGHDAGGAPEQLAAIRIALINDRVGQRLRNLLLDRLTPLGPPAQPGYLLSVDLRESLRNIAIRKDETATRANLTLTARFHLRRVGRSNSFRGTAVSTNSYNILDSDFATLSAETDARGRALRDLAEEIRTRIAAALTNPAFFGGGGKNR